MDGNIKKRTLNRTCGLSLH